MSVLDTSDMNLIDNQIAVKKGRLIQFATSGKVYVAKVDVTIGQFKQIEGSPTGELFNELFKERS